MILGYKHYADDVVEKFVQKSIENGIDIEPYISVHYNGACIQEIVKGLESKVDVSIYAKECYSWQQMREIRRGLKNRVNTDFYSNVLFKNQCDFNG